MDIPNLSSNPVTPTFTSNSLKPSSKSKAGIILIIFLAIGVGFGLSRLLPLSSHSKSIVDTISQSNVTSADKIKSSGDLVVGQSYGETGKTFKDSALGVLVAGGINGVGTHTLQRDGGVTQYAALTSSTVDLDLFIGRKVEIKGETNSTKKAGWFLDVGVVKVLE